MKNLKLIIAVMFFAITNMVAQKAYLKITTGTSVRDQISYPPGTKFELRDSNEVLIKTEKTLEGNFKVESAHTLVVSPNYKESTDVYQLTVGNSIFQFGDSYNTESNRSENYLSDGIYAITEITDSYQLEGMKNLVFELNNGIVFTYTDAKTEATLNGKNIPIKGKYVIRTNVGTAKVSFNPKNGSIWWVFVKDEF